MSNPFMFPFYMLWYIYRLMARVITSPRDAIRRPTQNSTHKHIVRLRDDAIYSFGFIFNCIKASSAVNYLYIVTVHGFPVPSSPCLVCVRVRMCMCEQVSVGVCDWGWFAPAESHHRWAISVPVTLSPLSDPCSVCGRRLRSVLVPRFLSPAASWTPIAGPWLPIASLRYPPQPYGKLRICLRKAPFLPTEAPPLPYGKLRFCLRKLRLCPTESSV